MLEWILQPWPWYVAGPLLGLMVPALLLLANKNFGVSTSLQHVGSMCSPNTQLPYLRNYDWKGNSWLMIFISGIILGSFIGTNFLSAGPVQFLPSDYYSLQGVLLLGVGGVMIGFGARYAGGCTSGHTIMGLSNLKWPSLVASISFFVGGLIMVHIFGF